MAHPIEFNIADWFTHSDPVQILLWVAYGFIVIASAAFGGFGMGFITQKLAIPFVGELSRKVLTRVRLAFGGLAGLVAVLMLNPGSIGLGSGAGQSGGLQSSQSKDAAVKDASLSDPKLPVKTETGGLTERPGGKSVLRILVLGDGTQPAYEPVNRFFAFAEDPQPRALDVEAVMKRVAELQQEGALKEVELVLTPQSTSLQNLEVQRLRQAVQQAGLRLYLPPEPK